MIDAPRSRRRATRRTKAVITIKDDLLAEIDRWVADGRYPNRSRAIESAVAEKIERPPRKRLAKEVGTLDPSEERRLAEDGFVAGRETCPAY